MENQIEYNSKLLNLNPTPAITKDDIKNMSKAEMEALLMELMEDSEDCLMSETEAAAALKIQADVSLTPTPSPNGEGNDYSQG